MNNTQEEDTLVVPNKPLKKELTLTPVNRSLTEDLVLDLSRPGRIGRIGRLTGAPNHENFYGVSNKVVSRNHVDFWEADGKYYMRDLGSAAGSFLNGVRLSNAGAQSAPFELSVNDMIQLGTNYTDDEASLNQDPTLRCIMARVNFRATRPIQILGGTSPVPMAGSPVDLNNLTQVMKSVQQKKTPPDGFGMPHSPVFQRSPSREDHLASLAEAKKNATADMYHFELSRKKELEEKLKDVQLKASSALSSVTEGQGEQFVISFVKQNHKVIKVGIQSGNKEVIMVNVKAWDQNKKLLFQDTRLKFSKSPAFEVIMDPTVKTGSRYHVVNHTGGIMMATIDMKDQRLGEIELSDGTRYVARGDLSDSYKMHLNSREIMDVASLENQRNVAKGNLSRILNVLVDKDASVNQQLVLSAAVLFGLLSP